MFINQQKGVVNEKESSMQIPIDDIVGNNCISCS